MSKVALVGYSSYEVCQVKTALLRGFSYFGGIKSVFRNKNRILLKPNLLTGENIEKAVTTHPFLLRGIAEILLENDFICGYGDSPGFGSLETVAKKAGIYTPLKNLKIEMADFIGSQEVSYPKALYWKEKSRIPQHNYKYCIRCYCCQELCPHGAIQIKPSSIGKLLKNRSK
ncbi:MAG: DUF362 domain-containing protein [Candidatus Atribacteria bacterium]|nr:DUF362 domain-containing protein [Candidatus Atribacteria bacterium]